MDVDTEAGTDNGLGGATNGHVHEYDDNINRTYVDYYDILAATKAADPDAIRLRNTFDNLAIISGGLHPTQAGCVKNSNIITNGRWRNGSLIFHMVRASISRVLAELRHWI